jgi:hypothetical protein
VSTSTDGLDRADVVAALYNAAVPRGMGFLGYRPGPMSEEDARKIVAVEEFDYVGGRPLEVRFDGDDVDLSAYDDNFGHGTGELVIQMLRDTGDPACEGIIAIHESMMAAATSEVRRMVGIKTSKEERDGMAVITLGMDDMKDRIEAVLEEHEL